MMEWVALSAGRCGSEYVEYSNIETPLNFQRKSIVFNLFPKLEHVKKAMNIREALFAPSMKVDVSKSLGQICSSVTVSCPPAILPVIPGEVISACAIEVMKYYGIESVRVVK